MIVNQTNLAGIYKTFNVIFQEAFAAAATLRDRIAMEVPSGGASNDYKWLGNFPMLREWIGDEAEIREIGCQYRAINQKHETLTVVGTVPDKRDDEGEHRVYLDVTVLNDDGDATCPGHAIVALPARGA